MTFFNPTQPTSNNEEAYLEDRIDLTLDAPRAYS